MGRLLVVLIVVGWLLLVGAAAHGIWRSSTAAAPSTRPPARWPADAAFAQRGRPQLLLFAHPKCPCTRATLHELARLQGAAGLVDTAVWFMTPDAASASFAAGSSWDLARAIPRTEVRVDAAAKEAHRFGANASGALLLYAADGTLIFNGGITPSRGHEGDSPGRRDLLALLAGQAPKATESPVYGCGLTEATR